MLGHLIKMILCNYHLVTCKMNGKLILIIIYWLPHGMTLFLNPYCTFPGNNTLTTVDDFI